MTCLCKQNVFKAKTNVTIALNYINTSMHNTQPTCIWYQVYKGFSAVAPWIIWVFRSVKSAVLLLQFSGTLFWSLTDCREMMYHKQTRTARASPSSFFQVLLRSVCLHNSQILTKHSYKEKQFILTLPGRHVLQRATVTTLLQCGMYGYRSNAKDAPKCAHWHMWCWCWTLTSQVCAYLHIPWI